MYYFTGKDKPFPSVHYTDEKNLNFLCIAGALHVRRSNSVRYNYGETENFS